MQQFKQLSICPNPHHLSQDLSPLTHEASRIGDVSADFAINLDEPLHADLLDLISCQGILESVPKENDEWKAFPQFVGTC